MILWLLWTSRGDFITAIESKVASFTQEERREGGGGQVDARGVAEATAAAVAERRGEERRAEWPSSCLQPLPSLCVPKQMTLFRLPTPRGVWIAGLDLFLLPVKVNYRDRCSEQDDLLIMIKRELFLLSFFGVTHIWIEIRSVLLWYVLFEDTRDIRYCRVFIHASDMALQMASLDSQPVRPQWSRLKYQQLLDGLPWHFVQTFMVPKGWILLTLVIPWLFF